jgi:hypothetical protein
MVKEAIVRYLDCSIPRYSIPVTEYMMQLVTTSSIVLKFGRLSQVRTRCCWQGTLATFKRQPSSSIAKVFFALVLAATELEHLRKASSCSSIDGEPSSTNESGNFGSGKTENNSVPVASNASSDFLLGGLAICHCVEPWRARVIAVAFREFR